MEKEIIDLVVARLQTLSAGKKISIGMMEFSRDEIIRHVRSGDAIGEQMIVIEMNYPHMLKEGIFYDDVITTH
jgi:hypothetical protein